MKYASRSNASLLTRAYATRPGVAIWIAGVCMALSFAMAFWGVVAGSGPAPEVPSHAGSLHLTDAQTLDQPGTGFTPAPYDLDPALLSGSWSNIRLPHAVPLLRLRHAMRAGQGPLTTTVTWYRLQTGGLAKLSAPRYLYVPRWKAVGQIAVYADSRLIYQSGATPRSTASNFPLWIPLDNHGDAPAPQTVLLRVQHPGDLNSALSSVWIGTDSALGWRYQWRTWLQNRLPLTSSTAFLAIGVFVFFVWLRLRQEKLYLLYTLTSVAVYIRSLHDYSMADGMSGGDAWFSWLDVNARFWVTLLGRLILLQLLGPSRPWLTRLLTITTVMNGLLTLPIFPALPDAEIVAPLSYIFLLVLALLVFSTGVWDAWKARSRHALLVAGWGLLGVVFGVHDWLLQDDLISVEQMFLGAFVNIGGCVILMYMVFQRYMGALDDVTQANNRLESRLRMRETELAGSYQRLREVEQREILNEERRRMTQDMHDGLGASLISALESVERGRLDRAGVAEMLRDCVQDLKLSIDSLEPVEADLLLLLGTLRFRIGPRLKSMGIDLHWDVREVPALTWLEPRLSLHILRILQEAFTNIIKHAKATEINVATEVDDDGVTVSIIDNGRGFVPEAAIGRGGRGLANQTRRAQAIGARVQWPAIDRGTHFLLWLPRQR